MRKNKTLLIVANVDWFLISHRLVLAKAAVSEGWKVYVACEDTGRGNEIGVEGIEFINFSFSRSGTNIFDEMKLLKRFRKLYREVNPDVVHQVTIKPVVYGSIAARKENIKSIVNAISGLGYMFAQGRVGLMQKVILFLMKIGTRKKGVSFIFQNKDDEEILKKFGVIDEKIRTHLIKGSGVDLNKFSFSALPQDSRIKILMPCRMLWDKGIKELREASAILRTKYKSHIQFILVGLADNDNKAGVPESYLRDWEEEGYVLWLGQQTDMVKFYRESTIVVLPSYREGLPKALIEACAVGRPIVTTDAVGCKDCVDEGINGFKVPVGDSLALASALETLIKDYSLMVEMGKNGRMKAEREFNVEDVVLKHLEIYKSS